MNSRDYWAEREAETLKDYITEEKEYSKRINEIYEETLQGIQSEIDAFYRKYATDNKISLREAKKRVRKLDIAEYERKAKRYVKNKDFSKKANEEMRIYNLTMKINRLEMLKANIGLEQLKGASKLERFFYKILNRRALKEYERQAGILGKSVRDNAKLAHAVVNASFRGMNFSDRIWTNSAAMKADLDRLITTGLIRGKNPRVLAREMRKHVIGGEGAVGAKYHAERLMRTELARVQTEAQKQSMEENGFELYQFFVNGGCCSACEEVAKKKTKYGTGVYRIKDLQPGLNAAPIHPNCRCSIAPYEDSDEYKAWLDFLDKGGTTEEWEKSRKKSWRDKIVDTFDLKFKEKGATMEQKDLISKAKTEVKDYFQVTGLHSNGKIFFQKDVNGKIVKTYTPKKLAKIIKNSKTYDGRPVKIYSCNAGADGMTAAQELANALGVPVKAPSDKIYLMTDGKYHIAKEWDSGGLSDVYEEDEGWIVFNPKRGEGNE